MQSEYAQSIARVIGELWPTLTREAAYAGVSAVAFAKDVGAAMVGSTASDGRAVQWHARLRLLDKGRHEADQIVADSDPDAEHTAPGATLFDGLPNITHWAAELASAHHNAPCAGLDSTTLARKLRSLRSQMSNRKTGAGCLRADYTVWDTRTQRECRMLARIDVMRADAVTAGAAPRRIPGIQRDGV